MRLWTDIKASIADEEMNGRWVLWFTFLIINALFALFDIGSSWADATYWSGIALFLHWLIYDWRVKVDAETKTIVIDAYMEKEDSNE